MIAALVVTQLAALRTHLGTLVHGLWAAAPTPGPAVPPPGPINGDVSTVLGWVQWVGYGAAILGLCVVGIKMMLDHQGNGIGGGGHTKGLGYVGAGMLLVGGASGLVGQFA